MNNTSTYCCSKSALNIVAAFALIAFIWIACTMTEARFLELLTSVQQWGVWVAFADGVLLDLSALGMLWVMRAERRPFVWTGGLVFMMVALVANLLDYFTTLQFSPDLALENSPVWNNIIEVFGLQIAIWFGFFGKVFLSVFAGLCFAFFLCKQHMFVPEKKRPLHQFIWHIGQCNKTNRERRVALLAALAFYFACMNLYCFYVAFTNTLVGNLTVLSQLPPLPTVIAVSLMLITLAFFGTVYLRSLASNSQ